MAKRSNGAAQTMEQAQKSLVAPELPEVDKTLAQRAEGLELGTQFDWVAGGMWTELFDDRSLLVHQSERTWVSDIEDMLGRSGQAESVLKALTLPVQMANLTIETPERDKGQADFIRDVLYSSGQYKGMRPDLTMIVAQVAYAVAVRKTFHELVFEKRRDGRIGYQKVAWRPPSSCELIRDRKTGDIRGFRQYIDEETRQALEEGRDVAQLGKSEFDDMSYVRVPANRAMIHVNGTSRDPINGYSDLTVTHWAHTLQQKILLLWAVFLDVQTQPKVITYGDTKEDAKANALAIATLRGSGVLGLKRDPSNPDAKVFEILETAGSGTRVAGEFQSMISYLERQMSHSVLAGFLDLTSNATEGIGSYALSADQKGLFLTSRQATAKEISNTITDSLIAPLVRINFGADAAVPRLVFERLSEDQSAKAIQMLQQLGSANSVHVPEGFIDLLVERVGQYLDLDDEKVAKLLEEQVKRRREMAEQVGRSPEESETFNGKVTDTVNAGLDVLKKHKKEMQ